MLSFRGSKFSFVAPFIVILYVESDFQLQETNSGYRGGGFGGRQGT